MDTESPLPRITIATVTYNAADTLEPTLNSVAQQTYPHIEHLIIDGCSQDGTMVMIHRYVDENSQTPVAHDIKVVKEPDRGLYDAMNKALNQAEGDYIVFLNAGDRLHNANTIERMVRGCNWSRNKADWPAVLFGQTNLVDAKGHFVRPRRLEAPLRLSWKSFKEGMLVCHQSFYARTDLANQEPYNLKYRYSADYDWCIRIMKRASSQNLLLHNTGMVLTDYLNEGLTTRNHRASLLERFRLMGLHYGWPTAVGRHLWFVVRSLLHR